MLPVSQRLFNLFGKHAFGADFGQGHVSDFVAGGLDDFKFNFVTLFAEQGADVMGLPERELRAAGTNAETGHQARPPEPAGLSRFSVFFFLMQVKQAAHQLDYGGGFGLAGRGLQRADGRVHDFVHDAASERVNRKFLLRR